MAKITTSQASDIIGVSAARVRRLALDGKLSPEKFGNVLMFDQDEVEAFANSKRPVGRPKASSLIDLLTMDDFLATPTKDGTLYMHKTLALGSIVLGGFDGDVLSEIKTSIKHAIDAASEKP